MFHLPSEPFPSPWSGRGCPQIPSLSLNIVWLTAALPVAVLWVQALGGLLFNLYVDVSVCRDPHIYPHIMGMDPGSPSGGWVAGMRRGSRGLILLGRGSSPPACSTKGQGWPFPEATRRLKNFQMRAGQPKVTARWQRGVTCFLLGLKKN